MIVDDKNRWASVLTDISKLNPKTDLIYSDLETNQASELNFICQFFWSIINEHLPCLRNLLFNVDYHKSQQLLAKISIEIIQENKYELVDIFNNAVVNYNKFSSHQVEVIKLENPAAVNDVEIANNSLLAMSKFIEYCETHAYIHGTNSTVLALMPETEHRLVSAWTLAKQKRAPIAGEFKIHANKPSMDKLNTRFGSLYRDRGQYSLKKIAGTFAHAASKLIISEEAQKARLAEFTYQLANLGHLTHAILELASFYQLGGNAQEQLQPKDFQIIRDFLEVKHQHEINKYLAVIFIAEYVENVENPQQVASNLHSEFTNFLYENKICLENYNSEDLEKIKEFLAPKGCTIRSQPRKANIECADWERVSYSNLSNATSFAFTNPQDMLHAWRKNRWVEKQVKRVHKYFELMDEMLTTKCPHPLQDIEDPDGYLSDPFPLIFVTNRPLNPLRDEFYSQKPLKLGEDVAYIGTPAKFMPRLQTYIDKHSLEVTAISFEQMAIVENLLNEN